MKISDYPPVSSLQSDDLFLVVTNPNEDPTTHVITHKNLMGTIHSNTSIIANFSVSGDVNISGNSYTVTANYVTYNNMKVDNLVVNSNGFVISDKFTPANSSIFEAGSEGKISFDDNYLYVKTANNNIKRVALASF